MQYIPKCVQNYEYGRIIYFSSKLKKDITIMLLYELWKDEKMVWDQMIRRLHFSSFNYSFSK